MIIDFENLPFLCSPTAIRERDIELVNEYKYLETEIDKKFDLDANTDSICKMIQQRLFFLRKIYYFKVLLM